MVFKGTKVFTPKFGSCSWTFPVHGVIFYLFSSCCHWHHPFMGTATWLGSAPTVYKIQGWLVGLKIQESIEKKNWPNFGTSSSAKLGIWWFRSETISLITGAHYYCGDGLVNVMRRNYREKQKRSKLTKLCTTATSGEQKVKKDKNTTTKKTIKRANIKLTKLCTTTTSREQKGKKNNK